MSIKSYNAIVHLLQKGVEADIFCSLPNISEGGTWQSNRLVVR